MIGLVTLDLFQRFEVLYFPIVFSAVTINCDAGDAPLSVRRREASTQPTTDCHMYSSVMLTVKLTERP